MAIQGHGGRTPPPTAPKPRALSTVGGGGPSIATSPFGLLAMTAKEGLTCSTIDGARHRHREERSDVAIQGNRGRRLSCACAAPAALRRRRRLWIATSPFGLLAMTGEGAVNRHREERSDVAIQGCEGR